jgi:hypothetical protein
VFQDRIHSHPEIEWEEVYAHDTLCSYFDKQGFVNESDVGELPTAFKSAFGPETGPNGQSTRATAINLEYVRYRGHLCKSQMANKGLKVRCIADPR